MALVAAPLTWWAGRETTKSTNLEKNKISTQPSASMVDLFEFPPLVLDVDPLELGVHRVRAEEGCESLPPYIQRDFDPRLNSALESAIDEGGFILLTGDSASGKTRTAVESIKRILPHHRVLAPSRGTDLRDLPRLMDDSHDQYLLWLDDLEGHLGSHGLQVNLLRALVDRRKAVIVATLRHDQHDRFRPHQARSTINPNNQRAQQDSYIGAQVLNMATSIEVPRKWSVDELKAAESSPDPRLTEAIENQATHGIAEYLAAGPQLFLEWKQANRAGGNPRGAALVSAAVDLSRVGLVGPIPEALLQALHNVYLEAHGGELLRPEPMSEALRWASTTRFGVTALLLPHPGDTWRPFDYLVDSQTRDEGFSRIPQETWRTALESASSPQDHYNIGVSAFTAKNLDIAKTAWYAAAEAGDMAATVDLGAVLTLQGKQSEGERYSRLAADAGDPIAALNLAVSLHDRNETTEAKKWYLVAIESGISDAAVNLGNVLADEEDLEEAEHYYRNAIAMGNLSGFHNLGILLADRFDYNEAEACHRKAATAGHKLAAASLGSLLMKQGKRDEALGWLEHAAKAGLTNPQVNLANILAQQQYYDEAKYWYEEAERLGEPHAALFRGDLAATLGEVDSASYWWSKAVEAGIEAAEGRQITEVSIKHDLTSAVTNTQIREKLDSDDLRQLYSNLWPVDCQSCGKSLGASIPSLNIDDLIVFGAANLHHPVCKSPAWSEQIETVNQNYLSWTSVCLVVPGLSKREKRIPVLLVNPGLEQVWIKPAGDRWKPSTVERFLNSGFHRSTADGFHVPLPSPNSIVPDVPVAELNSRDVTVMVNSQVWSAPTNRSFKSAARKLGGLYLWISTELKPDPEMPQDAIRKKLSEGAVAVRWIWLEPEKNDTRNKVRSARNYILYWNDHHASVGEVIGLNTAARHADQAKKWAQILLENLQESPPAILAWSDIRDTGGFYAIDALSAAHYLLHFHPDGWRLVRAVSRMGGTRPGSEGDLVEWATEAVRFHLHEGELTWTRGQDFEGGHTIFSWAHQNREIDN